MNTENTLRMTVYSAVMAALVAAGAFIAIPIGPVPIVLQNMFVLLAGLLLGRKWGLACISVYLLAGGLGLPVFSAGRGGFPHFLGPTGGYLLSYLPVVFIVGWISEVFSRDRGIGSKKLMAIDFIAMLIGSAVIYACGVPWLKMVTKMPWEKAITVGALPFLLGDLIKILAAVAIARIIRPIIIAQIPQSTERRV